MGRGRVTIGTVRTGDLRWTLVFGSGPAGAKVISVLELEGTADGRTLRGDTFAAISPAQLPATSTWGMLGIGYNPLPLPDGQGRLVTGDSTRTYVLRYDANLVSGNRISAAAPAWQANPSGFDFLTASAAAEAGKLWVVGISSGQLQVRRFDVGTGYEGDVVWSRALATGERAVPAFDPADRTRMAVVLYRSGGTRVVRLNLATGSVTADQDNAADFSSAVDPAPVALVPGGNGYLAGKAAGKSKSALWKVDGAGRLSETTVEFDTQPHATLLLESPERPELSIVADSAGATEPGQKATFTVTRAVSVTGPLSVTYRVDSPDGSAAEGVDWDRPSGVLALGAGVTSGKVEIQTRALAGCKATRTFRVVLTNADATLKVPEAGQAIAASAQCQLSIAAPPAPAAPGSDLVFTVSRTGDTSGPYPVTFTTAPGPGTSESDYVPPTSAVALGTGQATTSLVVRAQSTSETCRPQKSFTVTLTAPSAGGTKEATGVIAAVTATCGATASVASPAEPYLSGDLLQLVVDTSASPALDASGTTWEVVENDPEWAYRFVGPTPAASVKLQFTRVPDGGGNRTVRFSVPYTAGTPAPSVGTLTVRVADFRDLVRLDGPPQVLQGDTRTRRFGLRWLGSSARAGDWYQAPRQLVWKARTAAGADSTVDDCSGKVTCTTRPPAGVTEIRAEATLDGVVTAIPVQRLDVVEVPPPSSSTTAEVVRYVPVALESIGVGGADWETELTLLNRGAGTSAVDLEFRGVRQTEYVGGGRQFLINGLVERMREANASVATTAAPLKVTFRNLAAGETAEVLARTTTRSGADPIVKKRGRAGLAYAGLRSEELFGDPSGSPKRSGMAVLIGLRGTSDSKDTSLDRTNLAIVNPDATTPVTVRTRFFASGGARLFEEEKTLPGVDGNPFTQYSNLAGFTGGQEVAYGTVERVSGGVFTTYSTPIDNKSGDGSWVFPVPGDDASSTSALVVPVLLEVPGDAGKFRFLSDLTLTAPSGTLGLKADYFWQSGGGPATIAREVSGQTILGRSTQVGQAPTGVVQLFREQGSGNRPGGGTVVGMALVRRADEAAFAANQLAAGAKVDGPATGDPDGALYGRFGIFLPALRVESLQGLSELTIAGLRNDADVRSNLALYNPAGDPVDLRIDLYSSDAPGVRRGISSESCGKVVDGSLRLAGRSFCQVNGVLTSAGEPSIRSGYAIIARTGTDATQPFGAYGVINDNPTNDGAYLPPFLRKCGFTLSPDALPDGQVNVPYSQLLKGVGGRGPYSLTRISGNLPTGLDLSPQGLLSGTPTAVETTSFRVRATDSVGCTAEKDYTLAIVACPTITIGPSALSRAKVGQPYSESLTAAGGRPEYAFALVPGSGNLPAGLELRSNGLIQGTPGRPAGDYTFKVRVTDGNGCTAEQPFTLAVDPP
ncbi:MAG: hypothetical protein DYH06_10370 [Acidobacteria bacterium ACB2]|nr:hypothetical protein [Acidobacteria bacterium ACB2]